VTTCSFYLCSSIPGARTTGTICANRFAGPHRIVDSRRHPVLRAVGSAASKAWRIAEHGWSSSGPSRSRTRSPAAERRGELVDELAVGPMFLEAGLPLPHLRWGKLGDP
jgi:hypothetical protein